MHFLEEVLSSAEKVELDEVNKKVPELKSTIEIIKIEVIRYIENVYVKYSGRPKQNRILLNKALEIEEEIKTLKNNAEHAIKKELLNSQNELEKHITSLESINFALHVVFNLCHINESLVNFTELLDSKMYLNSMKLICNLEKLINEIPDDEYIEVIDELKVNINTKKNILLNELKNVFTDNINISENEDEKSIVIKIKKDINNLEQALFALYFKNSVVYPLHSFAKSLWNYVFVPVVDCTVKINISEDDKYHILKVVTEDATKKCGYLKVFSNLKIVLEYLKKNCNVHINEELTSLGYIGLDIRDNLSELLIKNCLQNTIPSNAAELQKYKVIIEDTKSLEEVLRDCHIFAEDTASIFEYANNVDILFINKKCNEYLVISQDIMKKDLHDIVEVGTPYNPNNPLGCNIDEFLQCSVSKSTIELLQFTEKIIQQALTASDVCGGRLFCTVQNIFRKYSSFVPEYHKKLLQTIPQQVALFHNNCFYITFKLTEWNRLYSPKMLAVLKTDNCGFKDEIYQLQKIASETFTSYVEGQLKQLNEIMKESGLAGHTLDKLELVTEKSIRQCLRQQELLKTVWHKVLPYPIYNKTLGVILNSLCNIIITSVVRFEDISCDAAEQLVEIMKVIFMRGPKLFTDPKEISLYVSSWYKLNELNFVLGASLLDINDRWADGKGPLALQFKPVELKQLIRALFQNTDRRSALLAKIQE
ncbi:centromere/kinetochore protein zw10 homolog [Anoplophora glabripennis]|uniref:centromere/kinetochore protein zw10 homolog n=1 Tax=Anoplophora glabripennis TaxID=217634 RepID=UPI000874B812|nr:centromere/kinetochore protein zw10 homolog [Anoplophora glabripennis]